MVGTTQMRALTRIAAETGVERLALIGDRRQLRAVEAGQPFALLQDVGMPTAKVDEVVRQRDADLRQAVLHMVADEPRLAVEELGNGGPGDGGRRPQQEGGATLARPRSGSAVHPPGERHHTHGGRPRDRHGARRPSASPPGSRLLVDRRTGSVPIGAATH